MDSKMKKLNHDQKERKKESSQENYNGYWFMTPKIMEHFMS
jgi:hypothetical protein